MKSYILSCTILAVALLCGCQGPAPVYAPLPPTGTNPPIEMPAPVTRSTADVVAPAQYELLWNPGGYSNFVVVTSPQLSGPLEQWAVYALTDQTNVPFVADQPAQFFAVYGTNNDGNSAWATQ